MNTNNCWRIATVLVLLCILSSCKKSPPFVSFKGNTMGTYYAVSYVNAQRNNHQAAIDSLLVALNKSVSTYIQSSVISQVNQAAAGDTLAVDQYFTKVFDKAQVIYKVTEGAFDPTVMPLVNAWGFGNEQKENIDSMVVDSLLQLIDFDGFKLISEADKPKVVKQRGNLQLDFSAIAKGYGVDLISAFLKSKGISNYLVDIGGELRASGKNHKDKIWSVGIDKPVDSLELREIHEIVMLNNKAIATSGNYRNFYVKDGKKYAHTINPKTGYPELSNLLSVSVFATDCMTADAYATAFMVMGYDRAKALVKKNEGLEALFIYSNKEGKLQTYYTEGVMVAR